MKNKDIINMGGISHDYRSHYAITYSHHQLIEMPGIS